MNKNKINNKVAESIVQEFETNNQKRRKDKRKLVFNQHDNDFED